MPKDKDQVEVTNQELEKILVDFFGGTDLRELIESGRLLKANGDRFIPAGEKIQHSAERVDYSPEEMEVFEAIKGDGVFSFPGLNRDEPDYRPIFLKQTTETYLEDSDDGLEFVEKTRPTMEMSDPLAPEEVVDRIVGGNWEEMKDDGPIEMTEPDWFNQMLDSISRFFGGQGTEDMNAYRKNQDEIKQYTDKINSAKQAADKVNAQRKEHITEAKSQHTKADEMKWINKALSPEVLGYDLNKDGEEERYEQDADAIDSFTKQIRELAEGDYKSRKLIRMMGSYDSHNPADNTLRKLYSAYRNEVNNGREMDLKGMLRDAAHKRETVNTMNLDLVLAGQAPIRNEQKNIMQK